MLRIEGMWRWRTWTDILTVGPFLGAMALGLGGCGGAGDHAHPVTAPSDVESKAAGVYAKDPTDPQVSVYVSKEWGFSTSNYFLEGPTGLVMIDMQFLPSAAEEAIRLAEAATGKKVVAGIALHANPDKFNGAVNVRAHGGKALTSGQVLALIPHIHAIRHKAFYERYKPDYPDAMPVLESFGDVDRTLELGGLSLQVHVMGAGCSESHVAVTWKNHVFVGDLVASGFHSWLEIGKTDAWIQRLAELRALGKTRVHPGRGPSGSVALLDAEESYLRDVIEIVASENPTKEEDDAGVDRAIAKIEKRYPKLGAPVFLRIGIPAEWARQARENRARRPG